MTRFSNKDCVEDRRQQILSTELAPGEGVDEVGFGGRDNRTHAQDQYTEVKTIWIDLTDTAHGDSFA